MLIPVTQPPVSFEEFVKMSKLTKTRKVRPCNLGGTYVQANVF